MVQIKIDTGDGYKYLELLPNLSFEKVNQFYLFSEIEYGRSVSFQVPRTTHNEKMLNSTGSVYAYGNLMRRELPCRVQYGAIEKTAKITIDSATPTSYSCTMYTDLSPLLDWVSDKKLKDFGLDYSLVWNYANAVAANDPGLTGKVIAVVPYMSEVPEPNIQKDEWCWFPSINISRIIGNAFQRAQSITGDYDTRLYDLFDEIPSDEKNKNWLILNTNNRTGLNECRFRMQNNQPITPVGAFGNVEFSTYHTPRDLPNGQLDSWKCDTDIHISIPQNFPSGIILAKQVPIDMSWLDQFDAWFEGEPTMIYRNLKSGSIISRVGPGAQTLEPGDIVKIPANTNFWFYLASDITWSSTYRSYIFSSNPNSGNFDYTVEISNVDEEELWPSQSSSMVKYHFLENAPDMSLMDLCKLYAAMTNSVLTFEDHELRFLKDAGYHDVEIKDCISFSEVERTVGDWSVKENYLFDSDDYVTQPVTMSYEIPNEAIEQSTEDHKLKCSEGFFRSDPSYFGDGIFIPTQKRLAVHDCDVEMDSHQNVTKISPKMKKPVIAQLQTGNVRTLRKVTQLPQNPYYKELCDRSTKVKAKWVMPIEDFAKMDHTYRFSFRGRHYTWLDAKWNNGIVECTLQGTEYKAVTEYLITVDSTNGGEAGTTGYARQGDTFYIWARPAQGFTFDHWELNGTPTADPANHSFTVTGDAHWHAVFLGDEVTITTQTDPANLVPTSGGGTYNVGQQCTISTMASPYGYAFLGWYLGNDLVTTSTSYTFVVTGSATYTAKFATLEKRNIQVSVSPQGVATVTGGGSYYDGTTCTVTTTPDQRAYAFVGWVDLSDNQVVSTSTVYSFVVDGDRSLQATYYGGHTISVSCSPVGAGTTYGGGFYNEGDSCTVGFTPEVREHVFDHWEENGETVSTSNPYTFTVHSDRVLVAVCEEEAITVTTNVYPSGSGTVTGGGQYLSGTTCTLTQTAANGYTFDHWEVGGQTVSSSASYSFTVTADVTVTAVYTQNNYTITVVASPQAGGTVSGGGTYHYGDSCTITATAANGYEFVGWEYNGTVISNTATRTFTVTESATFTALFSQEKYNIAAVADPNGSGTISGTGSYYYGQTVTLTATAERGYEFQGWREFSPAYVSTSNPYTFTCTGSRTLTAVFTAKTPQAVTTSPSPEKGGTCSVSPSGTVYSGDQITLTAYPNAGFSFDHWQSSGAGTVWSSSANPYTFTLDNSHAGSGGVIFTGYFTRNQYTVTASISPSGHGTITGAGTYYYGDYCECEVTLDSGYVVHHWEVDGVNIQNGGTTCGFAVTGNNVVVCYIEQGTYYTISAASNPRSLGTITGTGSYLAGSTCTLSISVDPGYTFDHWEDENGNTVSYSTSYTFTVTGDATFSAEGSQIMYTVNCSPSPMGSGAITGTGQFPYGTTVILEATPATGYTFDSYWENNVELSRDSRYSFTLTENRNIYARFTSLAQYVISTVAVPNAGGTVSGGGNYYSGSTCTLTATPGGKYYFHHWSETLGGASVSTSNPYSFTVSGNRTLYANFYENTWTIVVERTPQNGGTVSGGGAYTEDSQVTVTATPASGYHFVKWTENGVEVSRANPYTLTASRNETLTAVFEEDGPDYLTLTALEPTIIGMQKGGSFTSPALEYSTDGGSTWSNFTVGTTTISLATGESAKFRGDNTTLCGNADNLWTRFTSTGYISASGNAMSLLDKTCASTRLSAQRALMGLFRECTKLTTPPELPATTLTERCYQEMFYGCTALTELPQLPATIVPSTSYRWMFYGCTSLDDTVTIDATSVNTYSLYGMFQGCTSIDEAELKTTSFSGSDSLGGLFRYCSSLRKITVAFTSWPADSTTSWVEGVSASGDFYCPAALPDASRSWNSKIPQGWTKVNLT